MKLRVAKKIIKNQETLQYGKHQVKKAETVATRSSRRKNK